MNLQDYLEKMGISQRKFAQAIGVSHTTIYNITKGKRPSKENAKLVANGTYKEVSEKELLNLRKRVQITYK